MGLRFVCHLLDSTVKTDVFCIVSVDSCYCLSVMQLCVYRVKGYCYIVSSYVRSGEVRSWSHNSCRRLLPPSKLRPFSSSRMHIRAPHISRMYRDPHRRASGLYRYDTWTGILIHHLRWEITETPSSQAATKSTSIVDFFLWTTQHAATLS